MKHRFERMRGASCGSKMLDSLVSGGSDALEDLGRVLQQVHGQGWAVVSLRDARAQGGRGNIHDHRLGLRRERDIRLALENDRLASDRTVLLEHGVESVTPVSNWQLHQHAASIEQTFTSSVTFCHFSNVGSANRITTSLPVLTCALSSSTRRGASCLQVAAPPATVEVVLWMRSYSWRRGESGRRGWG